MLRPASSRAIAAAHPGSDLAVQNSFTGSCRERGGGFAFDLLLPTCLHNLKTRWALLGGWLRNVAASNVMHPTPPAVPDDEGLLEYTKEDSYGRLTGRVTANYFKRPKLKPGPLTIWNDNGEPMV